ncbi:hypothetical protein K490DRAFT_75269 [Saccharata proteae CBS 121410]|uniref:J domain-containing protein n=1 Tax=Saccharata proteae CBS 121410 TaxID=1314787 RepID=A0A9P4LVD9_9PEZI|nr:hypothetical protein K490DRAFT_75269 [Saccharata proteae CBS 121410]
MGSVGDAEAAQLRFKSKSSRRRDAEHRSHQSPSRRRGGEDSSRSNGQRHRHHSKRRKISSTGFQDDPPLYDDDYLPNARSSQYLDPDAAFRESLFDALADDEGAAYWEDVYGQPIHNYSDTYRNDIGELERMNEDEYAEYVRGKMWEKTHQHVIEERERRERQRKEQKEWEARTRRMETDRDNFQRSVEESLRRGQERKAKRRWKEVWNRYTQGWDDMKTDQGKKNASLRTVIPWPVETGNVKDVSKEEVEDFFRNVPMPEDHLRNTLKAERIRWHPDKMQQRFAEQGIDSEIMKAVTAVFQVIDRLWSDMRENNKAATG